jgi:anti-anti-sigma factor
MAHLRNEPFSVTVDTTETGALIEARGELDLATADALATAIADVANGGVTTLDLSGIRFLDSTGLRMLLVNARSFGERLSIIPSPAVTRTIEIAGVTDRLPIDQRWLGTPPV